MIYKKKWAGEKITHITSDRNPAEAFDNARNEIMNILKSHNFNVEESKALLNQISEDVSEIANDLIYRQDLNNLSKRYFSSEDERNKMNTAMEKTEEIRDSIRHSDEA